MAEPPALPPITGPGPTAASAVLVPVAAVVTNLLSYALLLIAAHRMSTDDYGATTSLLGLLLIATVPMLAIQTVAARRVAAGEGSAGLVRGTVIVGCGAAAVLAVVSPALAAFLHLHSPLGVLLVAATVPATAGGGAAMGVAQGRRNFRRLALLTVLIIGGRSAGGIVVLVVHRTPIATLVGVLIGCTAGFVAAVAVTGNAEALRAATRDRVRAGVVVEVLHAAHGHGSFLLLTSLDVLLARHVLSSSEAGVYGAGSVVTRAALWLPQSLVVLMFASLAESAANQATARRAALAITAVGAVVVAGTAPLGSVVVTVVGGQKYHELHDIAWLFALLGALLALVQLAMLAGLAQRQIGRIVLIWTTAIADVIAVLVAPGHMTPARVVSTLTVVAGVAAVAAVIVAVRAPARRPVADTLRTP